MIYRAILFRTIIKNALYVTRRLQFFRFRFVKEENIENHNPLIKNSTKLRHQKVISETRKEASFRLSFLLFCLYLRPRI